MAELPHVFLYTDGACSGNPGPGGWAFVLKHPKSGKTIERAVERTVVRSVGEFDRHRRREAIGALLSICSSPAAIRARSCFDSGRGP